MNDDGPKYAETYENQTWATYGIVWPEPIKRPRLNESEADTVDPRPVVK